MEKKNKKLIQKIFFLFLPASQSIHADAVAAEYLPGAQLEQEALSPFASVKRPAVQETHTVWPCVPWKLPLLQLGQVAAGLSPTELTLS